MKIWSPLVMAALFGVFAGFGLLFLDVFGSLILFLITYHLFADGHKMRQERYGALIVPYYVFILALYAVVLIHALNNLGGGSVVTASNLLLMSFGAILGFVVYGLKRLFRAYASKPLKQAQPIEE